MAMKQSKYSKRKPNNGIPKPVKPSSQSLTQKFLPKYQIGIWLDDVRSRPENLPEAELWFEPKSYHQFMEVIEELADKHEHIQSLFVSFDHYLSMNPMAPTGRDCLVGLICELSENVKVVHIEGHSSDSCKNDELLEAWFSNQSTHRPL